MVAVWAVVFLDEASPIIRLDSIVYPLALIGMTPLVAGKRRSAVFIYTAANIGLLVIYATTQWPGLGLGSSEMRDFLTDTVLAFLFAGLGAFFIRDITARALAKAALDIEERLRVEKMLLESNAGLEKAVEARTEELSVANDELKQSNQELSFAMEELKVAHERAIVSEKLIALGRVSASMAHELNTPLAAIAASNRSELALLDGGLVKLAAAYSRLGPSSRSLIEFARRSFSNSQTGIDAVDFAEERSARKAAAVSISAAGISDSHRVAEDIVELGLSSRVEDSIEILSGPESEDFLAVLRGIVGGLRSARVIEASVWKASRVVDALRAYIDGGVSTELRTIELKSDIESIVGLFAGGPQRGFSIGLSFDPGLFVRGRKEEMDRIWFNLLSNAIQAAGAKGPRRNPGNARRGGYHRLIRGFGARYTRRDSGQHIYAFLLHKGPW